MRGGHVPHRVPQAPERPCRNGCGRMAYGERKVCTYCSDANRKQLLRRKDRVEKSGIGLSHKELREIETIEKKDKDKPHGRP